MFDRTHIWGVFVAAGLAAACGGTQQQQASSAAADPAPINQLRSKYQTAYNAGDAAGVAALFTDDAVSLPDHHAALQGKAAIQQYLQEIFSQFSVTMTITPADTEIVGTFAHEHGSFVIKVTPKTGGETVTDDGKYLVVFERGADGTWKIHHDMDNSNRPPGVPAPGEAR
jgi:uncharacterized protein (TIGR02246 family)